MWERIFAEPLLKYTISQINTMSDIELPTPRNISAGM